MLVQLRPGVNGTGFHSVQEAFIRAMLTSDGIIAANSCVAIRDESEINYGDEIVIEKLNQIVDDEIGAVRTKRLIIEFERDFVAAITGG